MKIVASGLIVVLVSTTGCFTRHVIPTQELRYLDGYDIHNERSIAVTTWANTFRSSSGSSLTSPAVQNVPVTGRTYRMVSTDGTPVDFHSQTELTLAAQYPIKGSFLKIDVTDTNFQGILKENAVVDLPLAEISHAEVEVYDSIKTLTALTWVSGVLVVAVGLATAALFYRSTLALR